MWSGSSGRNFDCRICKEDKARMDVWGCMGRCLMAKPTMIDETDTEKKVFWSCPIRFVPDSIWEFIRIHKFYQDHTSASFPAFDDVSPRYLQAESFLNSELSRLRLELCQK